jgi:cytidine deaminase
MPIQRITPNLVKINGYFVELNDDRRPDFFDNQNEEANKQLGERYGKVEICDLEFDLRHGHLPLIKPNYEYIAYQQIPRFIELARRAASERAISYRDFNVGASAMAMRTDPPIVGYLFGANLTPYQGAPKRCAEMEVLHKTRESGFDRILALATFGPDDEGSVNSVISPTLHPCAECRTLLKSEPTVDDDTLMITSNLTGDTELMTMKDLLELHETSA